MRHPTPARWLAPLALLVAAIAVWATVNGTGVVGSDSSSPSEKAASTTTNAKDGGKQTTGTATTAATKPAGKRTYRVKPGDTFGAIAERTGLTVEELQSLNPDLDPNSLTVGDSVKLR